MEILARRTHAVATHSGRRHDRQFPQLGRIVALFAGKTHIDRVTLQPLHGLGDVDATDGSADHLVDILDIQPQPRGLLAPGIDLDIAAGADTLRVGGERPGKPGQHLLDLAPDGLDL